MMGCTDKHCRYLFRLLAPEAFLYSEMIVTGALIHGDADHFLDHSDDQASAIQLGGSDPGDLAICARLVEEAGYQEVNLNVGCPSDRVQQGGIGACLMAQPDLVARCFRAMADQVSIPVSVKSRIGIDDTDDLVFFHTFIDKLYDAGCRLFIVHARKAILKGLSPKENREIPPLKYDYVSAVQASYPDATFILNGGIKTVSQSEKLLESYAGVMLGRATYSNPYLLAELEQAINNTPLPARSEILDRYRAYTQSQVEKGEHIKHMAKHLFGLFTGCPGARSYRRYLSENMNGRDADISVLDEASRFVSHLEAQF
jgi:tRNA-dihydrouridine synthase A